MQQKVEVEFARARVTEYGPRSYIAELQASFVRSPEDQHHVEQRGESARGSAPDIQFPDKLIEGKRLVVERLPGLRRELFEIVLEWRLRRDPRPQRNDIEIKADLIGQLGCSRPATGHPTMGSSCPVYEDNSTLHDRLQGHERVALSLPTETPPAPVGVRGRD